MTGLNLTHRRAQRFADLVDATGLGVSGSDDGAPGSRDAVDLELLALVGVMRTVPQPEPRGQFTADLRDRLVQLAETELVAADESSVPTSPRPLAPGKARRPGERRIAVALTAVAIVGASSSMAFASQGALPGDALYPLKRVIEDAHAHLSVSERSEGTTLLHSAGDRLDEVQRMTDDDDVNAGRVTDGLDTFTDQLTRGADLLMRDYRERGDQSSIELLRRFDAASVQSLIQLDSAVPSDSQPALVAAAKTLFTIDASAGQLCPDCSEPGITEIPAILLASTTRAEPGQSEGDGPFGLGTIDSGAGGFHPKPTTSYSVRPSGHSSVRPTAAGSPTTGPTTGPTLAPTASPTGRTTAVSSPSSEVSDSPTDDPTLVLVPTDLPSLELPTELPSIDPLASDVATAIATSVSELLSGLTDGLTGGLIGSEAEVQPGE